MTKYYLPIKLKTTFCVSGVQMGGLLNMISLPAICGINEGDDLQLDLEHSDKAAMLLGMLTHLEDSLPPTLSDQIIDQFKQKGIRKLKSLYK